MNNKAFIFVISLFFLSLCFLMSPHNISNAQEGGEPTFSSDLAIVDPLDGTFFAPTHILKTHDIKVAGLESDEDVTRVDITFNGVLIPAESLLSPKTKLRDHNAGTTIYDTGYPTIFKAIEGLNTLSIRAFTTHRVVESISTFTLDVNPPQVEIISEGTHQIEFRVIDDYGLAEPVVLKLQSNNTFTELEDGLPLTEVIGDYHHYSFNINNLENSLSDYKFGFFDTAGNVTYTTSATTSVEEYNETVVHPTFEAKGVPLTEGGTNSCNDWEIVIVYPFDRRYHPLSVLVLMEADDVAKLVKDSLVEIMQPALTANGYPIDFSPINMTVHAVEVDSESSDSPIFYPDKTPSNFYAQEVDSMRTVQWIEKQGYKKPNNIVILAAHKLAPQGIKAPCGYADADRGMIGLQVLWPRSIIPDNYCLFTNSADEFKHYAAHEIGHAIGGLDHDRITPKSLLNPSPFSVGSVLSEKQAMHVAARLCSAEEQARFAKRGINPYASYSSYKCDDGYAGAKEEWEGSEGPDRESEGRCFDSTSFPVRYSNSLFSVGEKGPETNCVCVEQSPDPLDPIDPDENPDATTNTGEGGTPTNDGPTTPPTEYTCKKSGKISTVPFDCDEKRKCSVSGMICNTECMCEPNECGNGEVDKDQEEECDDGNNHSHDKCHMCKWTYCGDGVVQFPNGAPAGQTQYEYCDNGSSNGSDGICKTNCFPEPWCGDGNVDRPNGAGFMEECDPGSVAAFTYKNCTSDCYLIGDADNGDE